MVIKSIYELDELELYREICAQFQKYYSNNPYHEFVMDYINVKELYSIMVHPDYSDGFSPAGKKIIQRKSSGPYYNHIGRIVLRNLRRGIIGKIHLQGNELHDVIENAAKLGVSPKNMIKKVEIFVEQGLFEMDSFNSMLLLTRSIYWDSENEKYVEEKDDSNYLKYICLPPKNEIRLHGVQFDPSSLFPLPLLLKGNDIEDNIDKVTRGLYKAHMPNTDSIVSKFSEGHIIGYFLEHLVQSPKKDKMKGYHLSYTLKNYDEDSIEESSFELLKDLNSLEKILRQNGVNPNQLISTSHDTAKIWLDNYE